MQRFYISLSKYTLQGLLLLFLMVITTRALAIRGTTSAEKHIDSLLRAQSDLPTVEEKFAALRYIYKISKKIDYRKGLMDIHNQYGVIYFMQGEYKRSDQSFYKYYVEAMKINDTSAILQALNNRASVKLTMGYKEEALKLFQRATEFLSNKKSVEYNTIWYNIGLIYQELRSYKKAVSVLVRIFKDPNAEETTRIKSCNTLGIIYSSQHKYDSAFYYLRAGLKFNIKAKLTVDESELLNTMGNTYSKMNQNDSAIFYFEKALDVAVKNGHKNNELVCRMNIVHEWMREKKYQRANAMLISMRKDFDEEEDMEDKANFLNMLATSYYQIGKHKESVEIFMQFLESRNFLDSINSLTQSENFDYNVNKRLASIRDSLDNVRQRESDRLTIKRSEERTTYVAIILVVFTIALVFAFLAFRAKSKVAKQLKEQRDEIKLQKNIIQIKNSEVTDSINYARKLQQAILPSVNVFSGYFAEHALLYLPKDIVAGDFYFLEETGDEKNRQVIFGVADCTGHGVPGAMVSVVCSNALHRAITEFKLTDPGKILDKVRSLVLETFEKSGGEVKDGMDISLASLEFRVPNFELAGNSKFEIRNGATTLRWAGANNPLWIVRNGVLEEIKPDKQPIGSFAEAKPFTTKNITLEKGDLLYLFSDGITDQFGGDKNKKFKASRLKEIILTHHTKNVNEQGKQLVNSFASWKSGYEQTDDVCLLVLRV